MLVDEPATPGRIAGMEAAPARAARTRRARRVRVLDAVSWPVAAVLLCASLAWTVSGHSWIADLIANLASQCLVATLACLLIWVLARRWRLAAVAGVACAVHIAMLASGRAAIWPRGLADPRPAGLGAGGADPAGVVRFFHYNSDTKGRSEDVARIMTASDADVIGVVGPPISLQFQIIYGTHLSDRYPGKLVRPWKAGYDGVATDVTPCFVLSRWPITPWDLSTIAAKGSHLIAGVVERPGGRFGLIAVHPRSPRTEYRWRLGNEVVEAVAQASRQMTAHGLPVVVLTDLNSTPTGYRSRRLHTRAGLLRAKPLMAPTGTYLEKIPLGLDANARRIAPAFWPMSIAIDDAMISPDVSVAGWRAEPPLECEHRPITIDLRIPFETARGDGAEAPGKGEPAQ